MSTLDTRLDRWVEEGLISPGLASDLRRFEAEHTDAEVPATPAPAAAAPPLATSPAPPQRALSLVGEILGYLGAILAVTAIAFMLNRAWSGLAVGGRLAIVITILAIVATAGALAARVGQAPAHRLASVLLLATVALTGWLAWVVASDAADVAGDDAPAIVALSTFVAAAVIYGLRRRALAQIALLATLVASVGITLEHPQVDVSFTVVSLVWAAIGCAWMALAAFRLLQPPAVGLVTGGLVAIYGLQTAGFEDHRGWVFTGVVCLSAVMLGLAVVRRDLTLLMVPGGIGLLVGVPQLVDHLLEDDLATWLGVLGTGVALIAVAIWLVHERRTNP